MALQHLFEKKVGIEEAKRYLFQMVNNQNEKCLVSSSQYTDWMNNSKFPNKVNKQKWACEQFVAMAVQDLSHLEQSDYVKLINVVNEYGGSVTLLDRAIKEKAIKVKI